MQKILPKELTSYDLLKTAAVILMVIDHIGHFFFPEDMWFRVIGRLCVPIWFFLVGYANTTEVPKKIWIGAVIIALSALVAGEYLLPMNILFSIAILRIYRNGVVVRGLHSPQALRGMFLILLFLTLPTAILFEYGAAGMLFVMMGIIARHKKELLECVEVKYLALFSGLSMFSFFVMQGAGLPYVSIAQSIVMMFGFILVGFVLWFFKSTSFPGATKALPNFIVASLKFTGRRTLEIYVVHILIFRGIAMYLNPDKFGFMEWDYVPTSVISIFI